MGACFPILPLTTLLAHWYWFGKLCSGWRPRRSVSCWAEVLWGSSQAILNDFFFVARSGYSSPRISATFFFLQMDIRCLPLIWERAQGVFASEVERFRLLFDCFVFFCLARRARGRTQSPLALGYVFRLRRLSCRPHIVWTRIDRAPICWSATGVLRHSPSPPRTDPDSCLHTANMIYSWFEARFVP